jgi:hypothetical protein
MHLGGGRPQTRSVRTYLLCHRHRPSECRIVFAAWKGFDSPLRRSPVLASCDCGDHAMWWTARAIDQDTALGQLPPYVATRTEAVEVSELTIQ